MYYYLLLIIRTIRSYASTESMHFAPYFAVIYFLILPLLPAWNIYNVHNNWRETIVSM